MKIIGLGKGRIVLVEITWDEWAQLRGYRSYNEYGVPPEVGRDVALADQWKVAASVDRMSSLSKSVLSRTNEIAKHITEIEVVANEIMAMPEKEVRSSEAPAATEGDVDVGF
jgi:hypothetical protein